MRLEERRNYFGVGNGWGGLHSFKCEITLRIRLQSGAVILIYYQFLSQTRLWMTVDLVRLTAECASQAKKDIPNTLVGFTLLYPLYVC